MESWFLSKHAPWLCGFFVCMMMLPIFMIGQTQGVCTEEERKALLNIKASLNDFCYKYDVGIINLLPTWVDHGNTGGSRRNECCNWERVKCNMTTGHVTYLSLGNMIAKNAYMDDRIWSLNVSLFLHFKELRSLDLSLNHLDDTILSTGLERLSSLKKLETFNLSYNSIGSGLFPSLGGITSLKILDMSYTAKDYNPSSSKAEHKTKIQNDISILEALENLVVLDLTMSGSSGTFKMQGSEKVSRLKSLETLYLGDNKFNGTIITSLSAIQSLKEVDLSNNPLSAFPTEDQGFLLFFTGCESLSRLEMLETITLRRTHLDKSLISCLSFLPSLKNLDLSDSNSTNLGSSFPMQELSSFRELESLDLSYCHLESLTSNGTINNKLVRLMLDDNLFQKDVMRSIAAFPSLRILFLNFGLGYDFKEIPFELPHLPDMEILRLRGNNFNGMLPIEALASFHHLEVLDLNLNSFSGSIPSTIQSLSSLRTISFADNYLNGSLPESGLCDLKNLHELDLSDNMFSGSLPECFNRLSSLKLFDISSNLFTGTLPPSLFANLTSLEYVDFSINKFEDSFSFSLFSNHTKLEVVAFKSDNDKFVVITEEPKGWIPTFQLKVLVLSNCHINSVPSFLLLQHELRVLDMSHNSLVGHFPIWLIKNNTVLEFLTLRNNSLHGNISMSSLLRNDLMVYLDISENLVRGTIPSDIQKLFPRLIYLNISKNYLDGVIPSSVGDLGYLTALDLSHNQLSGEVPTGLLTNLSNLLYLKLSDNSLQGEVLSGNLSFGSLTRLQLDSNLFTGKIASVTGENINMGLLDISNNSFSGMIPHWIGNMSNLRELLVRNNRLEGQFPCGTTSFVFLDISYNSFSGPIPSCLNWHYVTHLHLGSNRFTGSIPASFKNLTSVLTLDIENNSLSGSIPEFLGELSNLRILLLGKNKFRGSISKQLCQLRNASLIDLSSNFLSGSIPPCLENITGATYPAFIQSRFSRDSFGASVDFRPDFSEDEFETEDIAVFTIKSMPRLYKGKILDNMTGLDLSCNKLTGEIPPELGRLTQIHVLNLSHNQLTGPIPVSFSNLSNIESMDLSSNRLSGKVPSELTKLNSLAVFNVSNNNLSGRLPDLTAQFGTFSSASYEGNPFLCGKPLEKQCTTTTKSPTIIVPPAEEGTEKWYDIDMASFYATWAVVMLGFAAVLYMNPYWRRRWLDFVEECMYKCYYFLYDLVRKPSMLFRN
uniref:receptor like protein 21-like n=1 Tax=Erigeron canadensis TaxID=72917 RepID=UPI001CB9C922|nr:receptor like protein 21-like [Erigeron canadensis]